MNATVKSKMARRYNEEFKRQAVELVIQGGKTQRQVAGGMEVSEKQMKIRKKRYRVRESSIDACFAGTRTLCEREPGGAADASQPACGAQEARIPAQDDSGWQSGGIQPDCAPTTRTTRSDLGQ